MNTTLKTLSPNKTVIFVSEFQGDIDLVRTGNCDSDLSFLHCFMQTFSKKYFKLNEEKKEKLVIDLYNFLVKKFWNTEINELDFFKSCLLKNTTDFYNFISDNLDDVGKSIGKILKKLNKKDENFKNYYKVIMELVSLDQDVKGVVFKECETIDNVTEYSKTFLCKLNTHIKNKNEMKEIPEEKAEFILNVIDQIFSFIFSQTEKDNYKNYKKKIRPQIVLNKNIIKYLSEKFQKDVFIIDSDTRDPLKDYFIEENIQNRSSVVFIRFQEEGKYEIVGELLKDNKVNRNFDPSNVFILKLKDKLLKKEKYYNSDDSCDSSDYDSDGFY